MGKRYSNYKNSNVFLACLVILISFFGIIADGDASWATTTPQIAAGFDYTVALKSDGTIRAVGRECLGSIGGRDYDKQDNPSAGKRPERGYCHRSAEFSHDSLEVGRNSLDVGGNSSGQLGDGTTTNRTTPVQVSGLSGVTAIAVGSSHTIALKSDGTVWAWGRIVLVNSGMGQ